MAHGSGQVHVRCLAEHRTPKLTHFPSEEAAILRWDEDVSTICEGVIRCFSTPQIVFGRYQCPHPTPRSAFSPNRAPISLTHPFQESKDVGDKLEDLAPWLAKLKTSLTATCANDNREEVERRAQLARFVSHIRHLIHPSSWIVRDPWKASRSDPSHCRGRGRRPGSSI